MSVDRIKLNEYVEKMKNKDIIEEILNGVEKAKTNSENHFDFEYDEDDASDHDISVVFNVLCLNGYICFIYPGGGDGLHFKNELHVTW